MFFQSVTDCCGSNRIDCTPRREGKQGRTYRYTDTDGRANSQGSGIRLRKT